MKHSSVFLAIILVFSLSDAMARIMPPANNTPVQCPAKPKQLPRIPNSCSRQYGPVCGLIKLEKNRFRNVTFSSSCVACNSVNVVSYTPGPCR